MSLWTRQQLDTSFSWAPSYDILTWFFVLFLPGSSLTLAAILFTLIPYLSVSIPICLLLVLIGFFAPMNNHRLPTDAGLQNPAPMGAFITGLTITLICYFALVWPRMHLYTCSLLYMYTSVGLWPNNWFWFIVIAIDYFGIVYLFW